MTDTIHVRIGKIEKGYGEVVLSTILGSCVAICIYCEKQKVYAMSHCLLAKRIATVDPELPGRHVPNAIDAMLIEMQQEGISRKMLQGMVIGGGNVSTRPSGDSIFDVGHANAQAAMQELFRQHIAVSHTDTGGNLARQLEIHCKNGDISVRTLEKNSYAERI